MCQPEWQKRSAGSFVPVLFYDITNTSFDESVIQSKQRDYNARLVIGYYYTFFIADKFFISPNVTPSIGYLYSLGTTTDNGAISKDKDSYVNYFFEGGLKAGFNSRRLVVVSTSIATGFGMMHQAAFTTIRFSGLYISAIASTNRNCWAKLTTKSNNWCRFDSRNFTPAFHLAIL